MKRLKLFFISSCLRTHTLCCKLCHYEIENGPNVIIPIKLRSFCFQFYSFIRLQYIQHKNVFAQLTKCLPIRAYTFWIACLFVRRLMVLRSFSFKYSIYQTQNWSYHHFQPKTTKTNFVKKKQLILWEFLYLNYLLI